MSKIEKSQFVNYEAKVNCIKTNNTKNEYFE